MARCSSTGTKLVQAGWETSADDPFEQHLPKVALFCLRIARDSEQAAALAERVLARARRKLASSRGAPGFSTWLYSILREECLSPVRGESTVAASEALHATEELL